VRVCVVWTGRSWVAGVRRPRTITSGVSGWTEASTPASTSRPPQSSTSPTRCTSSPSCTNICRRCKNVFRSRHVFTFLSAFYRATRGSRNSVRPSVCPSVCLSVTRVLCDKSKEPTGDIFVIPHEMTILLVFCYPTVVGRRRPLPPKIGDRSEPPFKNRSRRHISACNVSTVRASEKKFNCDE